MVRREGVSGQRGYKKKGKARLWRARTEGGLGRRRIPTPGGRFSHQKPRALPHPRTKTQGNVNTRRSADAGEGGYGLEQHAPYAHAPYAHAPPPAPGGAPSPPPSIPGSPLTYSPQVGMAPPSAAAAAAAAVANAAAAAAATAPAPGPEFATGSSGWPTGAPDRTPLVPTVLTWTHGGAAVAVEGSYDGWTSRTPLARSGPDFTLVKLLPPGVHQYKFVVDGAWRYAPDAPAAYDDAGNVNNVVEVRVYGADALAGLAPFDPPPSPPSSYDCPPPASDDFAKDPPPAPAHLQLTLLNVPQAALDAAAAASSGGGGPAGGAPPASAAGALPPPPPPCLPRPLHVVLNHVYTQRSGSGGGGSGGGGSSALSLSGGGPVVVGATHRHGAKYVTTVLYKPQV